MKSIEILKGWRKDFTTIFLEQNLFKNKSDEIDKLTQILALFSPFHFKVQFNIEDYSQFFEEVLSTKKYNAKVIYTGKKLFSKKQYRLVEICTDETTLYNIIALAVKYKETLEFELIFNDQVKVIGILYGDVGESHSIHFNSKIFNAEEIIIKANNIF